MRLKIVRKEVHGAIRDELEQLFADLVGRLSDDPCGKILVSFVSEASFERGRLYLLSRATDEGLLLYIDPIDGTLDYEFYLDIDD